jgi:sporulation protein YlmC with PRC-barrel domain
MNDKSSQLWRLTELLHWTARDIQGQAVGHIADVTVDPVDGHIAYLHIRLKMPRADEEAGIAIPWSAISRISHAQKDIRIAARRETLLRLGSIQPRNLAN